MTDVIGKATGPQRRPRKQEGAATPPPITEARDVRTGEQRHRIAYVALLSRIYDQVDLCRARLDDMPDGTYLEVIDEELLGRLMDLEKRLTNVRVDLDQLGCAL